MGVRSGGALVWLVPLVVGALVRVTGLGAQEAPRSVPISMAEAETIAREQNPAMIAARERLNGASEQARAASAHRWPSVEGTVGVARTDDPVGVFGMKLRQRRFGEGDFATDALNDPTARSDWTAGLRAGWTAGDPVRRAEARSARAASRAEAARLRNTASAVVFDVRRAYLDAVAAGALMTAVESRAIAMTELLSVVERRVAEGLATVADDLQARASLAEVEARVALAGAAALDARAALGVALGWGADSLPEPVGQMPASARARSGVAPSALTARADLEASQRSVEALNAQAQAASAAKWPALDVFGAWSTHAASLGGDRSANWSVGMEVRVPLFTGFALESRQRSATAAVRAAEAEHVDRVRRARAELAGARRMVDAARRAWDARQTARDAAVEAERLLALRYAEGMATLADVLAARARAAEQTGEAIAAEAAWGLALARLDYLDGEPEGMEESR